MKTYQITNNAGKTITLTPTVGLYKVHDFMGKELPGLAVIMYEVTPTGRRKYDIITVSFGEFIGPKNCVYIDLNNKPWAEQLLAQGFAKETDFKKKSGFCTYPLWELDEDMLNECGGKKYKQYLKAREDYMPF